MDPVLGREVVKGQQLLTIFAQALTRPLVLRLVLRQKRIKRLVRLLSSLGHPNLMQVAYGELTHPTSKGLQTSGFQNILNPELSRCQDTDDLESS
jgi:hypothetical protein